MLPTKTAKAKVFNIQASDSKEKKSLNIVSIDEKREKSFKTKAPSVIPPKSESTTFLVISANAIASSDGRSERAESSMLTQSKFNR